VKWGGMIASIILGSAWIASSRWYFGVDYERGSATVERGSLMVVYDTDPPIPLVGNGVWLNGRIGWVAGNARASVTWWFHSTAFAGTRVYRLPLWALLAPVCIVADTAWRLDRRARRRARIGYCPACNYDRRGIPAASVCPECGAAPAAPAQAST
jgi:hypothetical protein